MIAFIKSFRYTLQGIAASFGAQRNLKVLAVIAMLTIGASFYFNIAANEWCIVLLSIGLVIGLEMINTAIEMLVDLVTQEWRPLAGRIKDVAAGAVLMASLFTAIVGVIIFYKYCFV